MGLLSDNGWNSCYYMPYHYMRGAIENPGTMNPDSLAISISNQVAFERFRAVSFDVCCYPFVKKHLEPLLPDSILYHCWDLSLKPEDSLLVQKLRKKEYAGHKRIKTLLVPFNSFLIRVRRFLRR